MVTIAARLLHPEKGPAKDACIEKVLKKLNRPVDEMSRFEKRDPKCEKVMMKCGACHLPRPNLCTYRVTWTEGNKKRREFLFVDQLQAEHLLMMRAHSQIFLHVRYNRDDGLIWVLNNGDEVQAKVLGRDSEHVMVRGKSGIRRVKFQDFTKWKLDKNLRTFVRFTELIQGESRRIPIKKIEKIEWTNGGEPLAMWWDFKRLSPRGKKARRMFDISMRHRVGCTNCHVGHGDFRLTREGRVFQESGRVIRRVPLEDFLRGK